MKTCKTCLFLMCLLAFSWQTQAQSLVNVYTGGSLPTAQGWKELRFDNSMLSEQTAKNLLVAPSEISAVAGTALKLKVNEAKDEYNNLLYSQLGYYITRPGFTASNGYTVAFRARIVNSNGAFTVSGVGEGKGFRLEFSNNKLVEHANVLDTVRILSTADNTDGFHDYHVAVTPNKRVWVWRDGVLLGTLPLQPFKLDNILVDGGFENGGTPQEHGWIFTETGVSGTLSVSTDPAYVHSGKYGMFVDKGTHKNDFIPVKPDAVYDISAWSKTISYPDGAWRDFNGWHDPAGHRMAYFVGDRNNLNWKYNEQLGMEGGGDCQRFIVETPTSDLNNNQTAYDDIHYSERLTASRIPAGAVNLFPNGDFEDPCFHYFPEGDPRNDTCYVNPNNYRYSADAYYYGRDDNDPEWFQTPFNAEHNAAQFWHPFWGGRVRLQYQKQVKHNGESGGYYARGKYSLRFFNCGGYTVPYGTDFTGGSNENRGSNRDIASVPVNLEANATYTFLFSYHMAEWGGDGMNIIVKNGSKEIYRREARGNNTYPDWRNEAIEFTTDADNHALQVLTQRLSGDWSGSTPGVVYFDDFMLFKGQLLPEDNSHLFFGKQTGVKGAEVEIEYIKIDNTGAYSPNIERIDPAEWEKQPTPLSTVWGDAFPWKAPVPAVLDEYPRPQLKRSNWNNLNGIWDFTSKTLEGFGTYKAGDAYLQQILVPFPVESGMSGIKIEDYTSSQNKTYYYKKNVTIAKPTDGKRVILNFGAVDWESYVFVNGTQVAHHKGGFDPFSTDITDALNAGGNQEITVQVFDPTRGGQPAGKQNPKPGGDQYTPSSGIWQTVWTETVDPSYVTNLELMPVDNSAVKVKVEAANAAGTTATIKVLDGASEVATADVAVGAETSIAISNPKLWSPETPFLYNIKVELKKGGTTTDEVTSYFGMRKIEVKMLGDKPFIYLNDKVTFNYATLDHGFFPEGIFTPTSYEAMRYDLKKLKEIGFNAVRKFEKIEPAIWYHIADSLGLLVWQDIPAAYDATPISELSTVDARKANFLRETAAMTKAIRNFPSVVGWIGFNDGWGRYDYSHTKNTVDLFRSLNDGRLVVPESGADSFELGDVVSSHGSPPVLHDNAYNQRASVCFVTGKNDYAIDGHIWNTSSSSDIKNEETYATRMKEYADAARIISMRRPAGFAMVQTSDVEGEVNGLMTYDRKVYKPGFKTDSILKSNIDFMMNRIDAPILKTSAQGGEMWRFIEGTKALEPPTGWTQSNFDDSGWSEGLTGFGNDMGWFKPNTGWAGDDKGLYIRKKVNIPKLENGNKLVFTIAYDEDYEFYINNILASSNTGWTTSYVPLEISSEAAAAINYGGENIFAIHVIQNNGGSAIDLGLTAGVFHPIDTVYPVIPRKVIKIATAEDWMNISKDLNASYHLTADIDLYSAKYSPIGNGSSPFRGVINGYNENEDPNIEGDEIFTVICPEVATSDRNDTGLFGYAVDATFVNLRFTAGYVVATPGTNGDGSTRNAGDVGILLGRGKGVYIEHVVFADDGKNQHSVKGRDHVGVIAGKLEPGKLSTIKDVYVENAKVESSEWQAGGFAGIICDTRIINSYFTGTVDITHNDLLTSDNRDAAGIASRTEGGHSFFNGVMSLATEISSASGNEWISYNGGGFILIDSTTCFTRNDMALNPIYNPLRGGQFARATESMKLPLGDFKSQALYEAAGWNFTNVWMMPAGGGFPVFKGGYYVGTPKVKVENNLKVYSADGSIIMTSTEPAAVRIYSLQGIMVNSAGFTGTHSVTLPRGIYIVKSVVGGNVKAVKVINR